MKLISLRFPDNF